MKEPLLDNWKRTGMVRNKGLLAAFQEVPRENFVLAEYLSEAYGDYPLPIGHEQTISQPSTVMLMLDSLDLKKTDKVLEIGTGSGYSAALMAKLVKKVYSIEILKELTSYARENLEKTGIKNVLVIHSDGSIGYPKEAPYDKIVVTAAAPSIPQPLIEQLKEGGIILAPVGDLIGQSMIRGTKHRGKMEYENLGQFVFVPLKGKHGMH